MPKPSRRQILAAMAVLGALGPALAHAASDPAIPASAADQADIRRVELYLDQIRTVRSSFLQDNPDGSSSAGTLYLQRPGKIRFDYAPPTQMLIVSDGNYVAVDDLRLGQVQFYPADSTPIAALLDDQVKLSGDQTVTRIDRGPGSLRITLVKTEKPDDGSITLVFQDNPLLLRQWVIIDAQRRQTNVTLNDMQPAGDLKPDLFYLPSRRSY
jgi:outer membrane lipoprotein-sorting protein